MSAHASHQPGPLASAGMHLFQSISDSMVSAIGFVIPHKSQQVPFYSQMENKLGFKYIQN